MKAAVTATRLIPSKANGEWFLHKFQNAKSQNIALEINISDIRQHFDHQRNSHNHCIFDQVADLFSRKTSSTRKNSSA